MQMTISDWSQPSLIARAQGLPGYNGNDLAPHEAHLQVAYDVGDSGVSLWQRTPERVRIETETLAAAAVGDSWWIYDKLREDLRTGVGDLGAETDLRLHFPDVSWLRRPGVAVKGEVDIAGRAGILLNVPTASSFDMTPGADSYRLVVDTERGFLLRAEAILDGDVIAVEETEAIILDASLADEDFAPPAS